MNIRQQSRRAASLLRAALLFGIMVLAGLPSQAERTNPAEIYINPTSIIGDGNYYRVQFVNNGIAYLTENGSNQPVTSAAFDKENDGQLWRFIASGNNFRMQSKNGRYLIWSNNRFRTPTDENNTEDNAVVLNFYSRTNGYFEIYRTTDNTNNKGMYRNGTEIGENNRNQASNRIIINSLEYREVTHRISYLYDLNRNFGTIAGLATQESEYWDSEKGEQKVNEFKITHYVKRGNSFTAEFPTTNLGGNRHVNYQRFYNYDNETDIVGLEERIGNNNTRFYKYKNGFVTGNQIYWPTGTPNNNRYAQSNISYKNTDGTPFTLAVDVSIYSDYTYENATNQVAGNLEEPSLNIRYIYYMRDAKDMANRLTQLKLDDTPTVQTIEDENFYEEKEIHFPHIETQYKGNDGTGALMHNVYRGEFLGLRHSFEDYWVYSNNNASANNDDLLINLANTNRIEVVVYDEDRTGINLEGNTKGYFLYNNNNLNVSRFLNFRYPANELADGSRQIADEKFTEKEGTETKPAYVCCYLNNNGVRYKVAKFKIIFDKPKVGNQTKRWSLIKDTPRDPRKLHEKTGKPIAKITFDNPTGSVYKTAPTGQSNTRGNPNTTIANSGATPLYFATTNYAFDADDPYWGCYSLVTKMNTAWGKKRDIMPSNDATYGTGLPTDPGMTKHFIYIDASEQPGDICSVDFTGDFCSGDQLICTGWIAGSNFPNDNSGMNVDGSNTGRCPGSVTLTVKGERKETDGTIDTVTIKRYCPGNCYEIMSTVDNKHDQWQQFYFEFRVDKHYDHYWMEVNNNSVSSAGADFFLDDIEVYCLKPEVFTATNTPLCTGKESSDLRLLKLTSDFNQMLEVKGQTEGTNRDNTLGLVFLNKEVFLNTFQEEVSQISGFESYATLTMEEFEEQLNKSAFDITDLDAAYRTAFDAALLGGKEVWDSNNMNANHGNCVMNFHWNTTFDSMPRYSFASAMNREYPVYSGYDEEGRRILVMNANFPGLDNWEPYIEYYIVTYNEGITDIAYLYNDFDLRSECTKRKTFHLNPPAQLLGIEENNSEGDLEVCEGKMPTVLTDLKGLNADGEEVPLLMLNFDWWLGDIDNSIYATLKNYHTVKYDKQADGTYVTSTADGAPGVTVSSTIAAFRTFYPNNTDLIGVVPMHNAENTNEVTQEQIDLLRYLVQKEQLYLHTKSANVEARPVNSTKPYFYLVASPIHDEIFTDQLNDPTKDIMFFCDEPQGLRMAITDKAPTLSNGFANGANGIDAYNYPTDLRTLSLRLAKRAQFDVVRHGTVNDADVTDVDAYLVGNRDSLLFLPLREATVPTLGAKGVTRAANNKEVYLSMSDDPIADDNIYHELRTYHVLPAVGRIVQLQAKDKSRFEPGEVDNSSTYNRLVLYFYDDFTVHEGYNYTLSMPFSEDAPGANTCDGTLLLHLKIVPDYEVWTGLAEHGDDQDPDWSNDANWRRADADELLLVKFDGSDDYKDPNPNREAWTTPAQIARHTYLTNDQNYQSDADKEQRKGFTPLYCTHILMRTGETTDVAKLYDEYDGYTDHETPGDDTSPMVPTLKEFPFPNLRTTATDILKFDMQARDWASWQIEHETDTPPAGSKNGDLIAEMYQTNVCDEIVFQPETELVNAQHLTYNKAWVEYELEKDGWFLVGSPLQGMISGEWYAPSGTAQQKTTYYEPVEYNTTDYDRFSPAVYQRSWDKAKAVLYDRAAVWSSADGSQTENLGSYNTGTWGTAANSDAFVWNDDGEAAEEYLQRLSYRPMGTSKANVAIRGTWSNVFNDHTVAYDQGGFSVLVINDMKGNDTKPTEKSLFRLPKEDFYYDIWDWGQGYILPRRVRVYLDDGRPFPAGIERYTDKDNVTRTFPISSDNTLNLKDDAGKSKRGRLRSDVFKNEDEYTVTLKNEGQGNLGYFLVANPFICGLNVAELMSHTDNEGKVNPSVTVVTAEGQEVYSYDETDGQWEKDGEAAEPIVPQGQAFFLQVPSTEDQNELSLTFTADMMEQATKADDDDNSGNGNPAPPLTLSGSQPMGLVITASRGNRKSTAVVRRSDRSRNAFVESEDVATYIDENRTDVPTVYTLCGRLATTVNRLHDFRVLPIGIESDSNEAVEVSFRGVETLGNDLQLYDAVTGELQPLRSGTVAAMPGQTQNRYYIISGDFKKELVSESGLHIFCEGGLATVVADGGEDITLVNAYDPAGRLVYTAEPKGAEHRFTLPSGIYLIEARTADCKKTAKVGVK